MRGQQERSGSLFSYVSIEERIPASHPLRRIRKLADQAFDRLNPTTPSGPGEGFGQPKEGKKRAKGEPAGPESTKDEQPLGQPA